MSPTTSGHSRLNPELQSCYRFGDAICRKPGESVVRGLRSTDSADPDALAFAREHDAYVASLRYAGLRVRVLDSLDAYPDSVFVEDVALCIAGSAIVLRPGAESRFGERDEIRDALVNITDTVVDLEGHGFVDGGDILVTGREVLVGLSSRTDSVGVNALQAALSDLGQTLRSVHVPAGTLHFKTACALLDEETIFCTQSLAAAGCFRDYRTIECLNGEEPAANLIRINDVVLIRTGYPRTADLLDSEGYQVRSVDINEAAKLDGGLSCMSLRF